MRATVEPLEGNKVKLSIEIDQAEMDRAIDAAARKLAREVKMPGFRPGKVPRRVLEARLGKSTLRERALRESLPEFYASALRDSDVDAIAPPEIDITAGQDEGAVAFDAVVEVRPLVAIPGYTGLQVTLERPAPTDEEVAHQLDRMRANDAVLELVHRPVKQGDVCTIDLTTQAPSAEPNSLSAVSYTVGSQEYGMPELDRELIGARVGDILSFGSDLPDGRRLAVKVLVKETQQLVLPELTDEWAAANSEFATVTELKIDLRARIAGVKRVQASLRFRELAVAALTELVAEDPPTPLVNAETERRLHDLGRRLAAQGATIPQYLEANGQTQEQLALSLKEQASAMVRADLALRALAEAEALDVTEQEVDAEVERIAEAVGQPLDAVRETLATTEQMAAVRSDLRKSKALAWLLEHVQVVDPEGKPIDRAELEPPGPTPGTTSGGGEAVASGPTADRATQPAHAEENKP